MLRTEIEFELEFEDQDDAFHIPGTTGAVCTWAHSSARQIWHLDRLQG
jgi:hypothetical protein